MSPADWTPEELQRASLYGTCETCGAALAVRTVIDVDTGSSLMERFCPACGIVQ